MKNLTAVYKINGETKHIKDDYFNKKEEFKKELQENGFTVLGIFTDEEIKKIKITKDYEIIEKHNYIALDYIKQTL
jgi:hypothetical protein